MSELINNQKKSIEKGKNGGYRPGAGRKKGQKQKLSALQLLREIEKKDKPFAVGFAEDYHNARMSGDTQLIAKYQQMILNKVVADKLDVDHTTGGQALTAVFQFPQRELTDWTNVEKTITVKE
jgi:hypothetical protein